MPKIALIGATGRDWFQDPKKKEFVEKTTPSGYEMLNFNPRFGTHSVESRFDESYNTPFILEQVLKASRAGVDAIVIDCACDPALEAARELVTTPVVGMLSSALHLALTLGHRFGIITVQGETLRQCIASVVRRENLSSFCSSVRFLKTPVLKIEEQPELVQKEIIKLGKLIVEHEYADVLILGCTGLSHYVDLEEIRRLVGVPTLDPYLIGIWTAVMLIESGLSHSKIAYPSPPRKTATEPPSLKGIFDDILEGD